MLVPSIAAAAGQAEKFNVVDGQLQRQNYRNRGTVLDDTFLQPYPNTTGDAKSTPEAVQFSLRTTEWIVDKQDYATFILEI